MNGALFRAMWRIHGKMIWGLALGAFLYVLLIISVYPSLSPEDLNETMRKLPPAFQKLFGLDAGVQKLTEFLGSKFYTFLYLVLLMVYSVIMPVGLVARLVDRGSMAYLLSASVSRSRVITTQAAVFLAGLSVICFFIWLGGILGEMLFLDQPEIRQETFMWLNLTGFLLFALIGGISFVISCLADDEKKAMSLSAMAVIFSFALDMAGKLSDKTEWMRSLSVFSLFEPMELIRRPDPAIWELAGLAAAAAALYAAGVIVFRRRDLTI